MMRIGIDIGGTFTDIAAHSDGRMHHVKAPSTPDVISGIVDGVRRVLEEAGVDPARDGIELTHIHGTTIATNALLEHKGARLGLLGTLGHRDALEVGRMKRGHLYDLHRGPETPVHLAPGRRRIGIRERIDGQGRIVEPLDEDHVRREVTRLVERFGIEALAVCYLNSYANPEHERRTAEIVAEIFADLPISLSSDVNAVFREYERVCCAGFDAYVRPKVEHYVKQLLSGLSPGDAGLHLMQSRGGITSAAMATRQPITMFLSGPAAGVVAGCFVGALSERHGLITLDVGGTSTDVALIRNGEVARTLEGTIGTFPLRIPMVGVHSVGSGGGSIAWVDAGGGLHMGSHSAGSVPGPACYDRGGDQPTATDASVVLGYINPDYFAGGSMTLQPALAEAAITTLGRRVGLDPGDAALGMYRILVAQMADAIKLITVRHRIDPRDFCLVAFGGGGGVYAPAVARELGIREVLVPRSPGTLSAFGLLVADAETDAVRACFVRDAATADPDALEALYRELEDAGAQTLRREGFAGLAIRHARSADVRYAGQAYELQVGAPEGPMTRAALDALVEHFHEAHQRIYGHHGRQRTVEIVNLRTVSRQEMPKIDRSALRARNLAAPGLTPVGWRRALLPEGGGLDVAVYRRETLPVGATLEGPCLVEQADTTLVLHARQTGVVDDGGNMIIRC